MHTAGKVLLIIGGLLTAIGIGITVIGAASAGLDPSSENVGEGTSFTLTIPDDDIYGVYTKASVNCDAIGETISIEITKSDSSTNQFTKSCEYNEEDDYLDDDFQRVGSIDWFMAVEAGDTVTITSDVNVYIVGDLEALGDAAAGWLAAGLGIVIAVCGGVILLIGIILALTLKSKEPVVVMQQGGQMMGGQMMQQPVQQMQQPVQQMQQPVQQMQQPVQEMPQQTTQQGYEFEQK
ncbi:hypothetical protein N9L38_05075 [Candidatus Poseidoniales archaeon]|nr:hypothetical protein [Candidatus Poseidoniales archaeon]